MLLLAIISCINHSQLQKLEGLSLGDGNGTNIEGKSTKSKCNFITKYLLECIKHLRLIDSVRVSETGFSLTLKRRMLSSTVDYQTKSTLVCRCLARILGKRASDTSLGKE